jgi:hypothetical protein
VKKKKIFLNLFDIQNWHLDRENKENVCFSVPFSVFSVVLLAGLSSFSLKNFP